MNYVLLSNQVPVAILVLEKSFADASQDRNRIRRAKCLSHGLREAS
jgi:hypothetical protein